MMVARFPHVSTGFQTPRLQRLLEWPYRFRGTPDIDQAAGKILERVVADGIDLELSFSAMARFNERSAAGQS